MTRRLSLNFSRALLFASILFLIMGGMWLSQVNAAPLAASAGPNYAGFAAQFGWANYNDALGTNDNNCASSTGLTNTMTIELTQFSLNIPTGSTITGIQVEPKAGYNGTNTMSAMLLQGGAAVGGIKSWTPVSAAACSDTAFGTLGGAGDLWGATWSPSDINGTNFGVRFYSATNCTSIDCELDAVRITVFYDPPAVPQPAPVSAPKEVPEGDTLLLLGGGMGGLGVWLRWQWGKRKKLDS